MEEHKSWRRKERLKPCIQVLEAEKGEDSDAMRAKVAATRVAYLGRWKGGYGGSVIGQDIQVDRVQIRKIL